MCGGRRGEVERREDEKRAAGRRVYILFSKFILEELGDGGHWALTL